MHKASYLRMNYLVDYYEPYFAKEKEKIKVLDVGSYDVNGSYKSIFPEQKYVYTGLDMCAGPNVDVVPEDIYHWAEIEDGQFDLVISGQAFEHIEYPWLTIKEVARVLKPSGFCIITAPNGAPEHRYPTDCYRYFSDGLTALAKWADLKPLHVSVAGVPRIQGTDDWISEDNDAYLVAQKRPFCNEEIEEPFKYERRITITRGQEDTYKTFEQAVKETCKQFEKDKPIILFGAAEVGAKVIDILGEDKVFCFADNSKEKIGKKYKGKQVISLDELMQISDNYNCLITAYYKVSMEIREILNEHNINNYVLYPLA